ncbi:uncharacterized protein LOC135031250 isoform X2 [Pseudophryne corroboree]|uniref:uncharacterized protein LOC135031250 isoform X2 n=1 Tax=Pseudophryne corroboree TaxID=495146 RepID=UPI0030814928
MSVDASDCTPSVYFYIGPNDSDDEDEGFDNDCKPISADRIPLLTQIWNDISTWEEQHNPPLELAIKILRILQGLKMTPHKHKRTIASYDGYLNRRVAKVSVAIQEYKELLCTQVFTILEGKEQHGFSELNKEIQLMKKQIHHAKLLSSHKDHNMCKQDLDLEMEGPHIIISEEKQPNQRAAIGEEDDESTIKCPYFCKPIGRK